MPTGRVRCLGESPALVSAGAADNPRAYARKGTSTAAEPRLRACVTPVGLHGFVTGAWIVTPGNFREPAFTPVSERRRSRESDGPQGRPFASNASVTLQSRRVSLRSVGVTVKRSDGARSWSRVLTELAQVRVSVEWERPTWRVSWQDGPTREAMVRRAAALRRVSGRQAAAVRGTAVRPQQLRWCARHGRLLGGESPLEEEVVLTRTSAQRVGGNPFPGLSQG